MKCSQCLPLHSDQTRGLRGGLGCSGGRCDALADSSLLTGALQEFSQVRPARVQQVAGSE